MATLETSAAAVSGIAIVIISIIVFMVPESGILDEPQQYVPPQYIPPAPVSPSESYDYHIEQIPFVSIFEQAEGSVVSVRVETNDNAANMFGSGSGFVYDTLGHIITNEHVIKNAERITVTFLDGRSYNADIAGTDSYTDIAVIKADVSTGQLRPMQIGDSSRLRVGEPVAAIGNPFGLSGSMTSGIISQVGRLLPTQDSDFSIPDIIQIDAPINPGNSGGPLLNSGGLVIGMNTAIQTTTGQFAGIGFAIPSKTILKVAPYLITDGGYKHPWIGVSGIDIYPDLAEALGLEDSRGFLISDVISGSPAGEAGLRGSELSIDLFGSDVRVGGDIILSVDSIDVRKIDDILIHLQREKSVGDSMELKILRDGQERNVTLILEERPRAR